MKISVEFFLAGTQSGPAPQFKKGDHMLKFDDFTPTDEGIIVFKFTRKDSEKKEHMIKIQEKDGKFILSIYKEGVRLEQIEKPSQYKTIDDVLVDANKMYKLYY